MPFPRDSVDDLELDGFAVGFLLGLLVGEGHFGDHVVVKMHVRHEQTLRWLERTFPGSKIYGPYHHQGRHYMMWVAHGRVLYDVIVPLVGRHLDSIDDHVKGRFLAMCARRGFFWYPGKSLEPWESGTQGEQTLPESRRPEMFHDKHLQQRLVRDKPISDE